MQLALRSFNAHVMHTIDQLINELHRCEFAFLLSIAIKLATTTLLDSDNVGDDARRVL